MAVEAAAPQVWQLLAHPAAWPAWVLPVAHVSTPAGGSAPGEVRAGDRLRLRSRVVPVTLSLEVTEVDRGRAWSCTVHTPVGAIRSSQQVRKHEDGAADVVVSLTATRATGVVGRALLGACGPLVRGGLRRLAAIAGAEERSRKVARTRMCC